MKRLIIVRHAKSSWDDLSLSDFNRPLNERGRRDAPMMANRLKDRRIHPQLMLSSPAERALATCLTFAEVLGIGSDALIRDQRMYHAGPGTLLTVIQGIQDTNSNDPVFIFGHNPGLTDFANDLLNEDIDNIPTTGVVVCELNIDLWAKAEPGCGTLVFFDYPKRPHNN